MTPLVAPSRPLVRPGDFAVRPGFLNTASLGVPPASAITAVREALDTWARGEAQPQDYDPDVLRARSAFARLHGVPAEQVAIGSQASYFVGLVAASLPAGAEVVAYSGDFTSVLFPFLAREDLLVRLVELDAVADAVRTSTALVAVSAVQSADGRRVDLDAVIEAAQRCGAATLLDATQASGWLPFDATPWDFLVVGAYKWLLAPRGAAFMAVRRERLGQLQPWAAGWFAGEDPWQSVYGGPLRLATDARRLDLSPAWLSWVGAAAALEHLEAVGVPAVHAHDVRLAGRFRAGRGLPPGGSAIVAVAVPGVDAGACDPAAGAEVAARLAAAGVRVAVRAGRVRVSFHLYNTDDDVDLALAALAPAHRPGR